MLLLGVTVRGLGTRCDSDEFVLWSDVLVPLEEFGFEAEDSLLDIALVLLSCTKCVHS